mmetsp:Transcript_5988/g.15225  ORF Transcript_5988/g.15225 Transcript_5988/m.15225 type:complete len:219 (-) Transcript_5988:160-816(-)
MNLMKPICDAGIDVVSGLHCGEMGRPSSCSLSPCLKNSLRHLSAHSMANFLGRAGLEMSQMCITACMTWSVESVHSSGLDPLASMSALKSLRKMKCLDMSVARMMEIIIRLISTYCLLSKLARMLISGLAIIIEKTVCEWWFSCMLWSLCASARSVSAFLWKLLLSPSCPRSCAIVATRSAKISISDRNFSARAVVSMKKTPCSTSAACVELWYSVSV